MKSRVFGFIGLMMLSSTAFADHRHLSIDSAIGGGLGGAVGGFLGAEVGGRDGAIIGSGVGAALGTAYNTRDYYYGYDRPRRYYARDYHDHYNPRRYYRRHDYHGHHHGHGGGYFCPPGLAKQGRC